jgi:hypothetical protein
MPCSIGQLQAQNGMQFGGLFGCLVEGLEMQILQRGGAEDDEDAHPEGDTLERDGFQFFYLEFNRTLLKKEI